MTESEWRLAMETLLMAEQMELVSHDHPQQLVNVSRELFNHTIVEPLRQLAAITPTEWEEQPMGDQGVLSWNQPVCDDDWRKLRGDRWPTRVKDAKVETCAFCGEDTRSGIYIRENPSMVKYPARKSYA